ncbi:MAG: hypothetical protein ACI9G1_000743 [Pirellulaceae bacterium]|jgi:hypothetical protein
MNIDSWILIWKVCLIGTLAAFALLSVVVTIGGAYDVFQLLKSLGSDGNKSEET